MEGRMGRSLPLEPLGGPPQQPHEGLLALLPLLSMSVMNGQSHSPQLIAENQGSDCSQQLISGHVPRFVFGSTKEIFTCLEIWCLHSI